MGPRTRRITAALAFAALGAGLGGVIGAQWYQAFGPPWGQIGSEGEGLQEIFRGALAGALTGGLAVWFLVGLPPHGSSRALIVLGSIVAAVLFVVGSSFLGDLTNAGGPGSVIPYLALPALPGSLLLIAVLARLRRRARLHSDGADALTRG